MKPTKTFRELEDYWYARLAEDGFDDLEETRLPGRPLKRFDSVFFRLPRQVKLKAMRENYQRRAEDFTNSESFEEACEQVAGHGNSKVTPKNVSDIWEMHLEGFPERKIASEMHLSKSCIHYVIEKMKEWMNLS